MPAEVHPISSPGMPLLAASSSGPVGRPSSPLTGTRETNATPPQLSAAPRSALSLAIADSLMGPGSGESELSPRGSQEQGANNNSEDPEQPARDRLGSSGSQNREQFERSQREAIRQVLVQSPTLSCILFFLPATFLISGFAFYVQGWIVLVRAGRTPCDEPLAAWLLLSLCCSLFSLIPLQQLIECFSNTTLNLLRWNVRPLQLIVLLIGIIWFWQSNTCRKTNPELYLFVKFLLIFIIVSNALSLMLPAVLVGWLIYGLMHGWFDGQARGADPLTITHLETVAYDPSLFAEEGAVIDERPRAECCCCAEDFGPGKVIKRTPCQHFFHEECLEQWLRRSKTCPLCRKDLEEAVLPTPPSRQSDDEV